MDQSNLARSLDFPSPVLLDTRRYEIGRYGRFRLAFLREKHSDAYTTLIFTGSWGRGSWSSTPLAARGFSRSPKSWRDERA